MITALLLTVSALPGPAAETSKKTKYTDTVSVTTHPGWNDPEMAGLAALSGRILVTCLETTQQNLAAGASAAARQALKRCAAVADNLVQMMPLVKVVETITKARHKLLATDETDIVPNQWLLIDASLSELTVYAPTVAAQAQTGVKQAKDQLKQGKKQDATQTLGKVAEAISASGVYMPVADIDQQIYVALAALDEEPADMETAQLVVGNALSSLAVVKEVVAVSRTPGTP